MRVAFRRQGEAACLVPPEAPRTHPRARNESKTELVEPSLVSEAQYPQVTASLCEHQRGVRAYRTLQSREHDPVIVDFDLEWPCHISEEDNRNRDHHRTLPHRRARGNHPGPLPRALAPEAHRVTTYPRAQRRGPVGRLQAPAAYLWSWGPRAPSS